MPTARLLHYKLKQFGQDDKTRSNSNRKNCWPDTASKSEPSMVFDSMEWERADTDAKNVGAAALLFSPQKIFATAEDEYC